MNDQLQAALAAVIGKTVEGFDASVTFLKAEIPEVIEQLLIWKAVSNVIWAVLSCVVIFFLLSLIKKAHAAKELGIWRRSPEWSWEREQKTQPSFATYCVTFGGGLLILTSFFNAVNSAMTAVQILIAPKLYLIEYAARLAR